jgi:hypothetical protein
MLTELVGFLAAGLLGANSLFQFALAAGVGWGDMAFGGKVAQDDGTHVYAASDAFIMIQRNLES